MWWNIRSIGTFITFTVGLLLLLLWWFVTKASMEGAMPLAFLVCGIIMMLVAILIEVAVFAKRPKQPKRATERTPTTTALARSTAIGIATTSDTLGPAPERSSNVSDSEPPLSNFEQS